MLVLPYKASIIHKTAYVPVVTVLSPLCIFRSFDKMKRCVSSVFQFFLHQNSNAYVIEEERNVEFSKLSSRVYTISYHIRFP